MVYGLLHAPRELVIVEGADQLLEEPGTIDQLEHHAIRWFGCHLAGDGGA